MNALQNIKVGQDLNTDNKYAKHHQVVLESKVFDSTPLYQTKTSNHKASQSAFNGSGDFFRWSGEVKGSDRSKKEIKRRNPNEGAQKLEETKKQVKLNKMMASSDDNFLKPKAQVV